MLLSTRNMIFVLVVDFWALVLVISWAPPHHSSHVAMSRGISLNALKDSTGETREKEKQHFGEWLEQAASADDTSHKNTNSRNATVTAPSNTTNQLQTSIVSKLEHKIQEIEQKDRAGENLTRKSSCFGSLCIIYSPPPPRR